jgi:hypothetical protein
MTDGKNVQMLLLPKHTNYLERVPKTGQRQGQTEKVQEMRQEIYPQGEDQKMSDGDFRFDYMIASRDPGLSLSIMQLVKDLKTFARAVQREIDKLEKDPSPNQDLIFQERTILETTQKEIQRLERKAFYWEMGE